MKILAPSLMSAAALLFGVVGSASAQQPAYGPGYFAAPAPVAPYGAPTNYAPVQQGSAPTTYAQQPGPYSQVAAQAPAQSQPQLLRAGYYDPTAQQAASEVVSEESTVFDEALGSPCYDGCDSCGDGGCGTCDGSAYGGCYGAPRSRWFGTLGGLIMTRDKPNRTWFSAESTAFENQLLNSQDVVGDWSGGGEVRIGRAFGCGPCGMPTCGIEFTYWTLDPMRDEAGVSGSFYNTPINLDGVMIGANPADLYIDGSPEHRLSRRNEFHNLELNLLQWPVMQPNQYFNVSWLAGARFFRFDESLVFGAVRNGFTFGDPAETAYYGVRCENNLVGFQVGAQANCWLGPRLGLFATPKMGIYNNQISQQQVLELGDGTQGFDINTNKNDVAFLGELSVGLNYLITPYCNAYLGYRVVAVSGMALSDDQVPQFLIDTPEMERIESSGSLILHGAMAGVQFNY